MPWIQLKLNTTGANAEDLSDALMEAGSVSITFQDTHDTPVFEPLPGETRLWGDTDVIGLFDAETDMKAVVAQLEQHPLLGAGFAHKIEQLEDKDWEREWMDNFHPMRFGERLWICPSWRDVPDENAVNVMLDPGLALVPALIPLPPCVCSGSTASTCRAKPLSILAAVPASWRSPP